MMFHPVALVGKLILLLIILVILIVLHGVLDSDQFHVAFLIAAGVFVVGVVALWAFAYKVLSNPKSRLGKQLILTKDEPSEDERTASQNRFHDMVGRRGVALSLLRPSGIAQFGDKRVSVVTEGEFIDKDSPVEIASAEASRIVVRKVPSPGGEENLT